MDNAMNFIDKLTGNIFENLRTAMLCKVETFDHVKMKAELIPLVKHKNKEGVFEELEKLIEVPVLHLKAGPFIIRPPYKEDDIVVVLFTDNDIENVLLSGDIEEPNSTRKHNLDDALLLTGLMPFTDELPPEHENDLIIAKDDFTTKLVLKENGEVIVQGGKVYLGHETAVEGVPLGNSLKAWLDSHTHPDTGPPTSSSPSPSQVVKTI